MAKIKINTIHHQSMPMRDRARALGFWKDLLGLEIIPSQEGGESLIWMQAADGTMIHLAQRPPDDTPNVHTAFEVEDFDEALESMIAAG
jgi:catechol 2,3-dioxygenase-like lactoylglutathione lyase family enzyme